MYDFFSCTDHLTTPTQFTTKQKRQHFQVWWLIGLLSGVFMSPSFRPIEVIAFAIAGLMIASLQAFVTFPYAKQPRLIAMGALMALSVCLWHSFLVTGHWANSELAGICWQIGALVGATAAIWQLPLRMVRMALPRWHSL